MSETPPEEETIEEARERTETLVRRIGYVVFMGGGLLVFIPMVIAVANGISSGEVWDPYTHERVGAKSAATDCIEDAKRLIEIAPEQPELTTRWDETYRAWVTRCRDDHRDLYDVLRSTRQELREKASGKSD